MTMTATSTAPDVVAFLESMRVAMRAFGTEHDEDARWPIDECILRLGRAWEPAPLRRYKRREPRWCFGNTHRLVRRCPSLRYVEGYALPNRGILPVMHAWAVDAQDRVIDTTWDEPEQVQYYGVEIPIDVVEAMRWGTKQYSVFQSDWMVGHLISSLHRIPTVEEVRQGLRERSAKRSGQ